MLGGDQRLEQVRRGRGVDPRAQQLERLGDLGRRATASGPGRAAARAARRRRGRRGASAGAASARAARRARRRRTAAARAAPAPAGSPRRRPSTRTHVRPGAGGVPGRERQVGDVGHDARPAAPGRRAPRSDSPASRFRARVSRAAIVGVGTRNSRAMSSVGTPSTSRRVSAAADSGGSDGCAQSSTSRSRSSRTGSPASAMHPLRLLLHGRLDREQRQLPRRDRLGAQPVDDPAPRGGQQPRRRVVGYGVPGAGRGLEGVGQPVLGEVEPAVLRDEQGQQPAPLVAQQRLEIGHPWSTVARTSTGPSGPASMAQISSRSSRSSVSTT